MTGEHQRFGHAEHVKLAFTSVVHHGFSAGSDFVFGAIETLALEQGHPDRFHATLTTLWPRLVAAHIRAGDIDFASFIEREAILLDKQLPLHFYTHERLFSDVARKRFIEPDRCDLPRVPRF